MNALITILIGVVLAVVGALVLLNKFFKHSIFRNVGIVWVSTIIVVIVVIGLRNAFFADRKVLSIISQVFVMAYCIFAFYFCAIMYSRPLTGIVKHLSWLAGGHIAQHEVNQKLKNRQDELGVLASTSEQLQDNLVKLSRQMKGNLNMLNKSGEALHNLSTDVSNSANALVGSLSTISSSMEEMTSNIEQNSRLANDSNTVSANVCNVMEGVSTSMGQGVSAVNNIAERISVINDIAFQTNILALNAAVEAAHAGELGRGFAVVSAEIRNLAAKSRSAADEIGNLSETTKLTVQQTAQKMSGMQEQIQNFSSMMQSIAQSSNEESRGAEEVNSTISELTHVAEQNAQLAENLLKFSQAMQNASQELEKALEFFKE